MSIVILATTQQFHAQKADDKREIMQIIDKYSESVIKRDSISFYELFNEGIVTWCAGVKDNSHAREIKEKGSKDARSSYFSSSHKEFLRGLSRYKSTEDTFDNIDIIQDGTVASVTMDYSFWANTKMTNWGEKYLGLIKRDGKWKITSVIYSLELTTYFEQPSLKQRIAQKRNRK